MNVLATLRNARAAVAAFAAMGVLWGTFAADLPDLKTLLGVDESRLGMVMFMTPIAAVSAMLTAPAVGAALGRFALPGAVLLMCFGFSLPGHATALWMFPLFMMVCGAGTGLTDVLMNARVSAMEMARGKPLMNLCHAAYSFGYAAAALGTGALRAAGWSPAWVMGTTATVAAVLALTTYERDGAVHGLKAPRERSDARLGLVPMIGGAMVLIAFLTENAAENWSALHIEKTLGGAPQDGAMGPAALALTMGVARLLGQGLAERVRPGVLLAGGAVVAAIGALGAALAVGPLMAYGGFIVMGMGAALIAPTVFSLVGTLSRPEARARAVARATLLGYFGYFFGPPLLGFIAGTFGLRFSFVFAAALLLLIPILTRRLLRLA